MPSANLGGSLFLFTLKRDKLKVFKKFVNANLNRPAFLFYLCFGDLDLLVITKNTHASDQLRTFICENLGITLGHNHLADGGWTMVYECRLYDSEALETIDQRTPFQNLTFLSAVSTNDPPPSNDALEKQKKQIEAFFVNSSNKTATIETSGKYRFALLSDTSFSDIKEVIAKPRKSGHQTYTIPIFPISLIEEPDYSIKVSQKDVSFQICASISPGKEYRAQVMLAEKILEKDFNDTSFLVLHGPRDIITANPTRNTLYHIGSNIWKGDLDDCVLSLHTYLLCDQFKDSDASESNHHEGIYRQPTTPFFHKYVIEGRDWTEKALTIEHTIHKLVKKLIPEKASSHFSFHTEFVKGSERPRTSSTKNNTNSRLSFTIRYSHENLLVSEEQPDLFIIDHEANLTVFTAAMFNTMEAALETLNTRASKRSYQTIVQVWNKIKHDVFRFFGEAVATALALNTKTLSEYIDLWQYSPQTFTEGYQVRFFAANFFLALEKDGHSKDFNLFKTLNDVKMKTLADLKRISKEKDFSIDKNAWTPFDFAQRFFLAGQWKEHISGINNETRYSLVEMLFPIAWQYAYIFFKALHNEDILYTRSGDLKNTYNPPEALFQRFFYQTLALQEPEILKTLNKYILKIDFTSPNIKTIAIQNVLDLDRSKKLKPKTFQHIRTFSENLYFLRQAFSLRGRAPIQASLSRFSHEVSPELPVFYKGLPGENSIVGCEFISRFRTFDKSQKVLRFGDFCNKYVSENFKIISQEPIQYYTETELARRINVELLCMEALTEQIEKIPENYHSRMNFSFNVIPWLLVPSEGKQGPKVWKDGNPWYEAFSEIWKQFARRALLTLQAKGYTPILEIVEGEVSPIPTRRDHLWKCLTEVSNGIDTHIAIDDQFGNGTDLHRLLNLADDFKASEFGKNDQPLIIKVDFLAIRKIFWSDFKIQPDKTILENWKRKIASMFRFLALLPVPYKVIFEGFDGPDKILDQFEDINVQIACYRELFVTAASKAQTFVNKNGPTEILYQGEKDTLRV